MGLFSCSMVSRYEKKKNWNNIKCTTSLPRSASEHFHVWFFQKPCFFVVAAVMDRPRERERRDGRRLRIHWIGFPVHSFSPYTSLTRLLFILFIIIIKKKKNQHFSIPLVRVDHLAGAAGGECGRRAAERRNATASAPLTGRFHSAINCIGLRVRYEINGITAGAEDSREHTRRRSTKVRLSRRFPVCMKRSPHTRLHLSPNSPFCPGRVIAPPIKPRITHRPAPNDWPTPRARN